jgi:hypothetical protein
MSKTVRICAQGGCFTTLFFPSGLVGHVWNLFVVWILVSVELFLIRTVYTDKQLLTYVNICKHIIPLERSLKDVFEIL